MHQPLLPFFLNEFASFSLLIPIITALINYKSLDKSLKIIFSFVVFSFVLILVTLYCSYNSINDLVVFHFYAIPEFGFILWFFSYYIDGVLKNAVIPLVSVFAVWSIINFFFIQTGLKLNTYSRPLEAMFIVIYCVAFFNKQILADNTVKWSSVSYNWVTTAFLLFYSCSFFIFIFSNYFLTKGDKIADDFWNGYTVFLVLENVLLGIGFYKSRQQKASKTRPFPYS